MSRRIGILETVDSKAASRAVEAAAPGLEQELEQAVDAALLGQRSAIRRYVRAYDDLTLKLLYRVHEGRDDLVTKDASGLFCIRDTRGRCSPKPVQLVRHFAAEAPFSPWVQVMGPGKGIALEVLTRIRSSLPGVKPLPLPSRSTFPPLTHDPEALLEFARRVNLELNEDAPELQRVRDTFGLTTTEVAGLFGVKRQAASTWLRTGIVPSARLPKLATVAAIADVLERYLKAGRIAGVARKPAAAYGGRNMLQMIATDRHDWLLESTRESFDYSSTA